MKRRLPKGEDTIPIIEVNGKFKTPRELRGNKLKLKVKSASRKLLIERMKQRVIQDGVTTIYRFRYELSPSEQVRHMELGDEIGLELIKAEQKLLEEEIRILEEENGGS